MEFYDIPTLRAAFALRQGLDTEPPWPTVQKAIQQVAAVQIDSISVVARSHHLTLRNRVRNYHPDQLWESLLNREVFEYWAHACCFVPIEEYPYYRHRMRRFPTDFISWIKNLYKKHKVLMDDVETRIRQEGPLSSKDFEDLSGKKRGGFWDWKPAKVALDLLWSSGRIAVTERVNFQRFYDLAEQVIPSQYLDQHVEQDQVWRFFLERNLDCLVAATARDLCEYISCKNFVINIKGNRTKAMEKLLAILEQEDTVTRIDIPNAKQQYFVLTRLLPFLNKVQDRRHSSSRAWFLTPFDNLLWNRLRTENLFDMKVKLEAYTPPAERQFGYYVTPILWDSQLVGRIDPKADRETRTLIIRNLDMNLPRKRIPEIIEPIQEELERFKEFHQLEQIRIDRSKPASLKNQLVT